MRQPSFKEILESKLTPPTAESLSPSLDLDPAGMAFLIGQVGKFNFHRPSPYPHSPTHKPIKKAPKKVPVRPPRPRGPAHKLSEIQKKAFDYFVDSRIFLEPDFTLDELKKAFRQRALQVHPDRGGSTAEFLKLKSQYEVLKNVIPNNSK